MTTTTGSSAVAAKIVGKQGSGLQGTICDPQKLEFLLWERTVMTLASHGPARQVIFTPRDHRNGDGIFAGGREHHLELGDE